LDPDLKLTAGRIRSWSFGSATLDGAETVLQIRDVNPRSRFYPFFDPRSRDQKSRNPVPFSGDRLSNPESQTHIFESLVTLFRVKITIILCEYAQIFSVPVQK
jgi:hypothetical protein